MPATSPPAAVRPPQPRWGKPAETPTTLLLVRHGSTEHSHGGRFSGRNDLPLDAAGRQQAAATAALVAGTGGADVVLSSPLRRARETAGAVADELGVPVLECAELIELDFGAWEGLTFAEAERAWPGELAAWLAREDAPTPGGEPFAAVTARVHDFVRTLRAVHAHRRVVAVSHVSPIKTLLRLAVGAPHEAIFRLHVDTASLSVVDYYADGAATVRALNRVPPR